MQHSDLAKTIDDAFEQRESISASTKGAVARRRAGARFFGSVRARVAEKQATDLRVNQLLRKRACPFGQHIA